MNIASKRLSLLLLLFSVTANGQVVISPIPPSSGSQDIVAPIPLTFGRRPLFSEEAPAASLWNPRTAFGGSSFGTDLSGPIYRPLGYSWNFAGAEEQFDIQIQDSDPYSSFAIDDIFGCEAPQGGYNLEISEGVDFNTCFDRSQALVQPATDPVHLENDIQSCNCLRNSPLTDVKNIMELPLDQNSVINVGTRVRRVYQSGMDQVINGVAFQANVIAQNAPAEVRTSFVKDYSKNPFPYNPNNPEVLIRRGKEISLNLQPTENDRLGRDEIPYPEIKKANGDSVPVCLSMVAFHRMRQMPAPREWEYIIPDLSGDFDNDDWDYNKLQDDYDDLMKKSKTDRLSKAAEIAKLKTKLSFLNRNPLLKYFVGSEKSDYESAVSGGEVMSAEFDLKSKKAELFGHVKNALNKTECKTSGAGLERCGNDLRNSLRRFFGNPAHSGIIGEVVRSQMRKDIQERAKKSSKTMDSSLPDSQLNLPALNSRFQREFNIQKPLDCRVSTDLANVNQTTDQCLKKMSAYCQYLKPYEARILKSDDVAEDPRIADTLASDIEDDFNTDPSTNEAFQQANQEFCHTQFPSVDGKSRATFFEFLGQYCSDPSKEGCSKSSTGDWDKLRNKYKELYSLESGASNKVGTGEHDIITADTDTEGGGTGGTSGTGGGGGSGGSGGSEDDFWNAPVNPGCRKFCLGGNNSNSSSGGSGQVTTTEDPTRKPFFASMGEVVRDASGATTKTTATQTPDMMFNGSYQTDYSAQSAVTTGSQNIASKDVQEQIINQLQQKVDEVAATNPTSPELRSLQSDLAAIRAAFAQSQLANKSLTDKIAALEKAQEIMARNELGTAAPEQPKNVPVRGRSPSSIPNPRSGLSELDRTLSSVRETPVTASANVGGAMAGGPQRGRVTGGAEFSSDAIRREESKLINVENTVDGKLTITTNPRATGVTPNGVSVEVPMTLYQTIQSNPEGIDLSQIRISDVQKSQVGDREFTLLLSSGDGNPPFKVQVQIKNNRLVRADSNNDGRPDRQVQTVRLDDLNLIFRPIIQARN